MRKLAVAVALCCSFLFPGYAVALDTYQTEQAAQRHCPTDTVVWLNTSSGIWHLKGQRWYGRTKNGSYVCMKEASKEGYRGSRNGQ